jgi:uncharacterized protein RhaS with RHS repeats
LSPASTTLAERTFWLSRDPIGESGGLDLYEYAQNEPIRYIDPLGLDVRLEYTSHVYDFHERVSVDTPSGPYGQSFGLNPGMPMASSCAAGVDPGVGAPGDGSVYPDSPAADPTRKIVKDFQTTPDEDALALAILKSDLGKTGPYNITSNICRCYSQKEYDKITSAITQYRQIQQAWAELSPWFGY